METREGESVQGMDAASMTKGLCNDVVLNYQPLSPVGVIDENFTLNKKAQVDEINQTDASLNRADFTAVVLLTVYSTFVC